MHVGIANPRWRGKRSRQSRRMRNPQFYVSGKRPMQHCRVICNAILPHPGWERVLISPDCVTRHPSATCNIFNILNNAIRQTVILGAITCFEYQCHKKMTPHIVDYVLIQISDVILRHYATMIKHLISITQYFDDVLIIIYTANWRRATFETPKYPRWSRNQYMSPSSKHIGA